jgi:hypothetical protein
MASFSGPSIATNSLVLAIDSQNKKSNFLNTPNLIDFTTWTPGTNTLPWPANGDGSQNQLIYDTDPWGFSSLVLKTVPNNAYANGGWEGCAPGYWVNADKTKKYRSCVWVRRISSNTNGIFYHGLHTNGTGDVIQSDGTSQTNPYWACQGIGYLTQNQWYLHVGHIFPYNSTPQVDPNSGYWTRSGGWSANPGCNITGSDPRFPTDATLLRNRVYHYYASSDANSNIELLYPRIDVCDGTEPAISDILAGGVGAAYDLSSNGNHGQRQNGLTYNSGGYVFDGSTKYISIPDSASIRPTSGVITTILWFKATGDNGLDSSCIINKENEYEISAGGGAITYAFRPNWAWVGNTSFSLNTWYCVAITYDQSYQRLYVNGVQQYSASLTGAIGNAYSDVLKIAARGGAAGTNSYFPGVISNVQIYNRALSATEVQQNFYAYRNRYGI